MTGKVKAMKMQLEEDIEYEMTEKDWQRIDEDYAELIRKTYPNWNTPYYIDEPVTMKWDSDKEPLSWIPAECVTGIAKVLAYGADKYEKDNWRRGIPMSRYISAALRHIHAWNSGEDLDPESGLSHIDHAMCGLMFVQWYIKHRPECDDRYKEEKDYYQAEVTPPSYGG